MIPLNSGDSKVIMDPLHGGIEVYEHELKVINHPLFQRLRFVVQNDVQSWVFPGATHTRFMHSLGTMHVAGRLFQSIINNSKLKQAIEKKSKKHYRTFTIVFVSLRSCMILVIFLSPTYWKVLMLFRKFLEN